MCQTDTTDKTAMAACLRRGDEVRNGPVATSDRPVSHQLFAAIHSSTTGAMRLRHFDPLKIP